MKLRYILFTTLMVFNTCYLFGQNARFAKSGTIEFEKSVNMYAMIKKSVNQWNESYMTQAFDNYKKTQPQFKKLKSTMTFGNNKTLYTPEAVEPVSNGFFGNDPMVSQPNTVFTDLAANKKISKKKVYEETFVVTDTTRKIKWKITTETREIAGYQCRRANALVLDSIYVVAFYCDEIPVSGGPEGFSGLPGMILGLALPHENVTWFATKVTDAPVPAAALVPPAKGKAVTSKEFFATIQSALKDWGDYAQSALKAFSL